MQKKHKIKTKLDAFKTARLKKGFTCVRLAEKLKLSNQAIYKFENGTCNPSPITAQAICELLDKQFDELFYIETD